MAGVRKDVASLGQGWSPDLEWYAKAVGALQAQPLATRTSWRYLGAIHGFDKQLWLDSNVITDADELPPTREWNGRMWQQCQHQGWWFLPWHRGYLAAFEAIIAKTIVDLGGPPGWTLPYWNYLGDAPNARQMPQPFVDPNLPNGGGPNPLAAVPRGATTIGPQPWFPGDVDLSAMNDARFTSAPRALGFGGSKTNTFTHSGAGAQTGAVENDPHNSVHVMIGGQDGGFMADPDLAGLDPIFWLHHCNIDRLWAAWLTVSGNVQENGAAWRDGPSPRVFEMPDPTGQLVKYTPDQALPGGALAPTYDDLTNGTGTGGAVVASVGDDEVKMAARMSNEAPPAAVLVGANSETVTVGAAAPAATTLKLAPAEAKIAGDPVDQRVFLNLENVRGTAASGVLNVRLGVAAAGATPASAASETVKPVALFGLKRASSPDDGHGGNGISVAIDITESAKALAQKTGAPLDSLVVHLDQPGGGSHPITVERVSIYRQPVE